MKPFMAARRPVGGKGRGCLYPGERYDELPAGLSRAEMCSGRNRERVSWSDSPDSENERHEAP